MPTISMISEQDQKYLLAILPVLLLIQKHVLRDFLLNWAISPLDVEDCAQPRLKSNEEIET